MKELMNKGEMVDNFITNSLAETAIKITNKQKKFIMID
jgi:adenylate kinase family enzyme